LSFAFSKQKKSWKYCGAAAVAVAVVVARDPKVEKFTTKGATLILSIPLVPFVPA
jgi:hypothetical protein